MSEHPSGRRRGPRKAAARSDRLPLPDTPPARAGRASPPQGLRQATLRQMYPREYSPGAMCVRTVDFRVLQFTRRRAVCCVLHRPTCRVIHRLGYCVNGSTHGNYAALPCSQLIESQEKGHTGERTAPGRPSPARERVLRPPMMRSTASPAGPDDGQSASVQPSGSAPHRVTHGRRARRARARRARGQVQRRTGVRTHGRLLAGDVEPPTFARRTGTRHLETASATVLQAQAGEQSSGNDPSAGSPTETLLRLLLPLSAIVRPSSRRPVVADRPRAAGRQPRASTLQKPHYSTRSVVATGGVYKGQGRNQRKLLTHAYWEFLVRGAQFQAPVPTTKSQTRRRRPRGATTPRPTSSGV